MEDTQRNRELLLNVASDWMYHNGKNIQSVFIEYREKLRILDELIGGDGSSPLSDTDKYHGADLTFLLPYLEFVKNLTDMPEDVDDVTCRLQQISLGSMVKKHRSYKFA